MSIDQFFLKKYDARFYNCAHFAKEFLEYDKKKDLSFLFDGLILPAGSRCVPLSVARQLTLSSKPIGTCLAWFRGGHSGDHVGAWYKGRVLHLPETGSVQYASLEVVGFGFRQVRFVLC